jgi:uncharacterized membrane protein required for colicin V production
MQLTPFDFGLISLVIMSGLWGLLTGAIRIAAPFAVVLAAVTLLHAYPNFSAQFGTGLTMQFCLVLLLAFIGLVIYGFVIRILHGAIWASGLGPLDRLFGLVLGLVTGTLLTGALVWALQTYSNLGGAGILNGSILAPAVVQFFQSLMTFTERIFPRSTDPTKEPWWKKPLW